MSQTALAHDSPDPQVPAPTLQALPGGGPARESIRPTPRLEIPSYDLDAALVLRRELGVSHALAQILVRRGFQDPLAARAFLDPRERHDPGAFAGIEAAVEALERQIAAGGRVVVHGDYDVDGVCATAIMVRALRALGADVRWFLPARIDDGYGLSIDTVHRLAASGTELLLTVDCAITAVAEVAAARETGLAVVVTDHHHPRPDGLLPDCPIVHPVVCGYPCEELCGTGVAYKLASALGAPTVQEDIELVALATVADLMPLRGENRTLVRAGLAALANTARPGLRALMEVSQVDPSALDAHALGFRLAPRINAAGRLRRADAGLELLLTTDEQRAGAIASELDAINVERRAVEQRIVWEAEAQADAQGDRPAFVLAGEGWHPGVIGIVASRIVERHHRPAILVAIDEDGSCQGSGRSIPGFDLLEALHAAAPQLERYGGHRAAAGLTVQRDRIDALRDAVEQHAAEVLTDDLLQPVERVDAVVSGSELGLTLAEELEALEPCGIGNPRPRLLVPGARLDDPRPMGEGKHLRFSVSSGGVRARAVAFGCGGRLAGEPGQPVDATFLLERNVWRGAVEARLVLRQVCARAPAPIEVLGEDDDYLHSVLHELRRTGAQTPGTEPAGPAPAVPTMRTVLDRRGESPIGVLVDTLAAGGPVLAVCADIPRRMVGLSSRVGGFALISYDALGLDPSLGSRYPQLIALDPPTGPDEEALLGVGFAGATHPGGYTQLAWGEPELRFAQQMHELEYGLRASLVALYRSLRLRQRVTGEELEQLLRGDGPHGRPARLAGRLIRVLAELELVSLDPELPALAIASTAPTALERSPAYRAYSVRYEDGRQYLSSANLRPSG